MRTIFFISDGTGITAEALGRSLLSQFETFSFEYVTIPYVDNTQKAEETINRIKQAHIKDGERPIIFTTLVNSEISNLLHQGPGFLIIDFFQTFINPLESELKHASSHKVGQSHGVRNYATYMGRINAVNYALAHDDGMNAGKYAHADIILFGVSRCGKTPTCLYLALQYGIYAANYPLTEEDMKDLTLPSVLLNYRNKLFGLTIDKIRLQRIRQERFPNKKYSSQKQCSFEIEYSKSLFKKENIRYLDTSSRSIEEIAAEILTIADIKRRI